MHLINEALNKRRRALFVADRITLIGLTSVTAESTAEVPREISLYELPMAARSQDDINNGPFAPDQCFGGNPRYIEIEDAAVHGPR